MDVSNILAVSGLPGLYTLVSSRSNGLVVADIDSGKNRFCSVRKHQFTPLETVAIYTNTDTTPLVDIFQKIKDQQESNPVIDIKSSDNDEIEDYFLSIVPDYDEDRVYVSDMKKVIKWYNFLESRGMLEPVADEEE